tara:strand:- start:5903 stop:6400 length:498 start_codon:yes stop_codon:yes gene_type:complete
MNKRLFVSLCLVLGLSLFLSACTSSSKPITNFKECVAAGYPIMESFPEQCMVPGGKIFTAKEKLASPGKYCQVDKDCTLVNLEHGFGCCWIGSCDRIDYSLDKWAAINKEWFSLQQKDNCPSKEPKGSAVVGECGPAPGCASEIINDKFKAACVESLCVKIPVKE